MSAIRLYTPDVLALATSLTIYPLDAALPLRGEARSPSCGSTLTMGIETDAVGVIRRIGLAAHACAIGQASAAIFAAGAPGLGGAAIERASMAIATWLAGEGEMPDWPGLAAIAEARAYPARHGAILLAWRAASQALSQTASAR
jgi:NifU-like protein involved in Fe-S cluster formation